MTCSVCCMRLACFTHFRREQDRTRRSNGKSLDQYSEIARFVFQLVYRLSWVGVSWFSSGFRDKCLYSASVRLSQPLSKYINFICHLITRRYILYTIYINGFVNYPTKKRGNTNGLLFLILLYVGEIYVLQSFQCMTQMMQASPAPWLD